MARIDNLIGEVGDDDLRQSLLEAVSALRIDKKFGLVFEDHIPETVALPGFAIETGALVQYRRDIDKGARYRVVSVSDSQATIQPVEGGKTATVDVTDLLVVSGEDRSVVAAVSPQARGAFADMDSSRRWPGCTSKV